ncbi:cation-translocating P-type ATPase [Fodinibius salsisoli]|uniref:Cation-transporting P-type ATPase n=1 Tax=Fodinibius salsisoli TaxID=2820877 RepID=A0ABT3PJ06_9BACT|nr:cation-transporting P-type ATPase [Fodinibius salsisoli]MCW9705865.1 cation-transporting P-type ATPase [Fodinibius salsisoli]
MSSQSSLTVPDEIWAAAPEELLAELQSNKEEGLSQGEIARRLKQFGPNQLKEHKNKSLWHILADQVKSLIILLLVIATIVSFLYNEILEGWAIVIVIVINTAIGFFTELRAVRSMESLFKLGKVETRVRRKGAVELIPAPELVPGDIVLFEGGDVITADLRIIEASKLQADESALTGESLPVSKKAEAVAPDTVLAERSSMLYKGTWVTRGSGEGVVVSTGLETELGQISLLVEEADDEQTPLEKRLDRLGYRLIILTLIIAFFISITGILSGKSTLLMIETGIALAVAAIPEGLPIVATIALAKGLRIMAEKNALVNRLSSVETLGATETIFTDKTGTLTENRMSVVRLFLPAKEIDVTSGFTDTYGPKENGTNRDVRLALETGMLCNNATFSNEGANNGSGDPLEVALLEVGYLAGIEQAQLTDHYPEVREEAFDPEVKMMATWNEVNPERFRISVKGAPDAVWDRCQSMLQNGEQQPFSKEEREKWESINHTLAADGLRVIALAFRETDTMEGHPYEELTFLGLAGLLDPPRKDVKEAMEACKEAGIRVVMVTGDQPATSHYIARSVGLVMDDQATIIHGKDLPSPEKLASSADEMDHVMKANIFARISPRQKLDLIELYQKNGHIVAMTGDGVNDAPALKKADIGIAMGKRGTQVAREAADMVLTDDAFSTIVSAIKQGRAIFSNIRRFVYYLLSCNVSEVLVVGLAALIGLPLPLLPLQILFLNLVTDVFPALALGVGEESEHAMQQPPRKSDEPILNRKHWMGIGSYGLVITASVLGALFLGMYELDLIQNEAVTLSFLTLAFAQLWHVFNMRSNNSSLFHNSIVRNPWVWGAIMLCLLIIFGAVYVGPVAEVLDLTPPGREGWIIVVGMSLVPLVVGQLQKILAVKFTQKART